MTIQIDHIVHIINRNPSEAVSQWADYHYDAVMGGHHEKWGTYNSLLYTGLSYIEYLAIEKKEIAQESDNPLIQLLVQDLPHGEGLSQICFRTSNISELKESLQRKGFQTSQIFPGSRRRNDGKMISWKMLFILDETSLPFPFFIQWEQSDQERFEDLREIGLISNKLADSKITEVSFVVRELDKVVNEWEKLFEDFGPKTRLEDELDTSIATIEVGNCELSFYQPKIANHELSNFLKQRGERPYSIGFEPPLNKEEITLFGVKYK